MTTKHDPGARTQDQAQESRQHGRRGHGLMMIACCIPMLAIAIVLVAIGAVSPVFIVAAVGCTVMMALMMGGMNHGGGGRA